MHSQSQQSLIWLYLLPKLYWKPLFRTYILVCWHRSNGQCVFRFYLVYYKVRLDLIKGAHCRPACWYITTLSLLWSIEAPASPSASGVPWGKQPNQTGPQFPSWSMQLTRRFIPEEEGGREGRLLSHLQFMVYKNHINTNSWLLNCPPSVYEISSPFVI